MRYVSYHTYNTDILRGVRVEFFLSVCRQKNADTYHAMRTWYLVRIYTNGHGVVFSMWGGVGFNLAADLRLRVSSRRIVALHPSAPHRTTPSRTAPWAALRIPVCARLLLLASVLPASGLLSSA